MIKKIFSSAYMAIIFAILYAPIVVLIVFSFNSSNSTGVFEGFSLRWYAELFQDEEILSALYNTLIIAISSSFFATIIGTFAALAISKMRPVAKTIVMNVSNIPVYSSEIVMGVSLMLLFIALNIKLGAFTMLLAHITFNVPYVLLSVLPKIRQLNPSIYEAALDLGAPPQFAFRKVVLPELMPGIISGALLAFTLSLDDFIISYFTTGSGFSNLSMTIYAMTRRGIPLTVNALSTLMFVTVIILLLIINIRNSKQEAKKKTI